MRAGYAFSVSVCIVMTALALMACKKKRPTEILASCDFRGIQGGTTCTEVHDPEFVGTTRGICMQADPSGGRWRERAGCNRAGSLGACWSETATNWHFPSATKTSAEDVKKECAKYQKFAEATASETSAVPTASSAPVAAGPKVDFTTVLGTKDGGWAAKPFVQLKHGMTPAEAAKIFPGADKLKSNAAEIPVTNVPGVAKYRLYFLDKKLARAEIWFEPSLHTKTFRDEFIAAATTKWGPPKSDTGSLVFWFSPTSRMATLGEEDGKQYKLEMQL